MRRIISRFYEYYMLRPPQGCCHAELDHYIFVESCDVDNEHIGSVNVTPYIVVHGFGLMQGIRASTFYFYASRFSATGTSEFDSSMNIVEHIARLERGQKEANKLVRCVPP